MFGHKREKYMEQDNAVTDNSMYITNILERLNTTLTKDAKELHRELMSAVQRKRQSSNLYRDIKYIYDEEHFKNKYGELHVDPKTLKEQRESVKETKKQLITSEDEISTIEKSIEKIVSKNELTKDEEMHINHIKKDLTDKDNELASKIESFINEIKPELVDIKKKTDDVYKIHELNDALKSFSAHKYVEPGVAKKEKHLQSKRALQKLESL